MSDDLKERLLNPMWVHSNLPPEKPYLDDESTLADLKEALARIEALEAQIADIKDIEVLGAAFIIERMRNEIYAARTNLASSEGEHVTLQICFDWVMRQRDEAREALAMGAEYLDHLEGELISINADMKIGEEIPPSVIADRLRAALKST